MTGRIHIEHRWVTGLALSFIMAAAPCQVFSQKARSEVAPIAIPHGGKTGGTSGQKEARKALEKSVQDRKQGEKITQAESIVWKGEDRPADSAIRKSVVAALKKQGYSYEVLYDGTANNDNGQGAIYFQATPEEDGETVVGMWLGFSDDEYKLVWTSLTGGPGSNKADTEEKRDGDQESSSADSKPASRGSNVAPLELPEGVTKLEGSSLEKAQTLFETFLQGRGKDETPVSFELAAWVGENRPEKDEEVTKVFADTLRERGYAYKEAEGSGEDALAFEVLRGNRRYTGFWSGNEKQLVLLWGQVEASADKGESKAARSSSTTADNEKAPQTDAASGKSDGENAELAEALYKKGLKALADDRGEDAAKAFKNVLQLNPDHKGAAKALQALDSTAGSTASSGPASEAKAVSNQKEASKSEPAGKPAVTAVAEKPAASSAQDSATTSGTTSSPDSGKDQAATDALRRLFGKK